LLLISSIDLIAGKPAVVSGIASFISRYSIYIIIIYIVSGYALFSNQKEALQLELQAENKKQYEAASERGNRFAARFSKADREEVCIKGNKANKIDVKRTLQKLLCYITKKIYSEGLVVVVILILIVLISALIQLSIIDNFYFWTDEVFSFNAAKMIIEKGEPLFDSGLYYGRASIYHNIMARSMQAFGINEFGSRLLNVLFNACTAVLIYIILRKTSKIAALLGSFLYMFSGLTVLMTIETRFYSMFAFLFLSVAYTYYKSLIEHENDDYFFRNIFQLRENYIWPVLFLIFLYLAYNTHNFFFLFFFGLALYYLVSLVLTRSWKTHTFYLLIYCLAIFIGAYYLTGTLNLYAAFFETVTLSWATELPLNPSYYTAIIENSTLFYNFFLACTFLFVTLSFSREQRYYFSILIAALFIISNQRALQERYLFFLVPLVIIVLVYAIYYYYILLKNYKWGKHFLALLVSVFLVFHLNLYVLELRGECNSNCLAVHKKLAYSDAMSIIDQNIERAVTLIIADHHAAYTLIAYDYNIDYIVIPASRTDLIARGKEVAGRISDPYFLIPYLVQGSPEFYELLNNKPVILVVREGITVPDNMVLSQEQRPRVYLNF